MPHRRNLSGISAPDEAPGVNQTRLDQLKQQNSTSGEREEINNDNEVFKPLPRSKRTNRAGKKQNKNISKHKIAAALSRDRRPSFPSSSSSSSSSSGSKKNSFSLMFPPSALENVR